MPLSSALQARLIQRGILNSSKTNAANESASQDDEDEQREEVFAENYDERDEVQPAAIVPRNTEINYDDVQVELEECVKCPNKWNPYHTCVEYCKKRYGLKIYAPDAETEKRRRRMLKKYPLPSHWREVTDANLDRCYYWNLETDEVSWLPPAHPRSHFTQSAMKLRQQEMERKSAESMKRNAAAGSNKNKKKKKKNAEDAGERSDTDDEDLNPIQKLKRKIAGKMLTYDADPMDPSSYSDVPRGSWATGLDIRGKAKTGVDETASGELFQMRPYPSPGDILRINADIGKKKPKN